MYSKARPISKISIYFRLCFELAFLIGVPVQEKTNSLLTCYVTVILVKKLNVKLKSSCSQDKVTGVVVLKLIVLKNEAETTANLHLVRASVRSFTAH